MGMVAQSFEAALFPCMSALGRRYRAFPSAPSKASLPKTYGSQTCNLVVPLIVELSIGEQSHSGHRMICVTFSLAALSRIMSRKSAESNSSSSKADHLQSERALFKV